MTETLTVFQLNERVHSILGTSPGVRDIWVAGEISNLVKHSSGHYYFTLKDSKSEIRCSLFKGSRARMNFEPKENMKVTAFGRVDIYVQRGQYQFIVETMRSAGIGDLYAAYEELKQKLQTEGLFESARKKKIPKYPRTVGVVTSPTGAAIHDILTVSKRRFPADIVLYPALVQGDGAAVSIVRGIEILNREKVDVMIVGRGGGSIEDMWAFNEEIVARAIASSSVPIISAVGHETDFTISDLVADVRAPTPSAAAEIALPDKNEEMKHIDNFSMRLSMSLGSAIETMKNRFKVLDAKLSPKRAVETVERMYSKVNELSLRVDSSLRSSTETLTKRFAVVDAKLSPKRAGDIVDQYILRLDDISVSADSSIKRKMSDSKKDIVAVSMRLNGLDPSSVLKRGYSLIQDSKGRTLTTISKLKERDVVEIKMRDGSAKAEIKEITK